MRESVCHHHKLTYLCCFHRMNAFFYGNSRSDDVMGPRILPLVCSEENSFIDFASCRFSAIPSQSSTARVSLFNSFSSCEVLTLEASFFGHEKDAATTTTSNSQRIAFTTADYKSIGASVCKSLAAVFREEAEAEMAAKFEESNASATAITVVQMNVYERLFKNFKSDARAVLTKSFSADADNHCLQQ